MQAGPAQPSGYGRVGRVTGSELVGDQPSIEQRVQTLEREIGDIRQRNERVEMEKAWELSRIRIAWILVLTYILTAIVFWLLDVRYFLLNALIPTLAYYLSTRSLGPMRRWWLQRYCREPGDPPSPDDDA